MGYPARSVFKLEELHAKFDLFKPGMTIMDVGAAPGSWSKYLCGMVGLNGRIVAIDLSPLRMDTSFPQLLFRQADVFSDETAAFLAENGPYDVVVSDAAPSTTGNRTLDTARSEALVEQVLALAEKHLKSGGSVLVKLFQGINQKAILDAMKQQYQNARAFKPKATRSESFETYFVGMGKL